MIVCENIFRKHSLPNKIHALFGVNSFSPEIMVVSASEPKFREFGHLNTLEELKNNFSFHSL